MGVLVRSLETFRKGFTFTPLNPPMNYGISGERSYRVDVGDGSGSSLVEACVLWIANAVTQTTPAVLRYDADDDFGEVDRRHAMARLMRRPTFDARVGRSSYSWIPLIQATLISFVADGNAYWRKRRSGTRTPVQLWYMPHDRVTPVHRDGSDFLVDYYEIRGGAQVDRVSPADMVHFRDGIDPGNPLLGISKLRTLLREIYTDEQAARWTASLLRNQAVPGVVLSPEPGALNVMSEDEAKLVKARLDGDFTEDNRGSSIVLGASAKLQQYGYSPDQMKLGDIRDIPEERVSAVLGVPAGVVGFGAGLQTTKTNATMGELVDLGWQNGVLPRTRLLASELTEQLLPDFDDDPDLEFVFDTARVPIMADYQDKIAEKHERLMRSTIETRAEARRAVGLKTGSDDDVFTLSAGATVIQPDGKPQFTPPKPPVAPAAPAAPALPAGEEQPALPPAKTLTSRQERVAQLLDEGILHKNIAVRLGISDRTAERDIAAVRDWQKVAVAAGS
jgi:HK97 family phage portal protein